MAYFLAFVVADKQSLCFSFGELCLRAKYKI